MLKYISILLLLIAATLSQIQAFAQQGSHSVTFDPPLEFRAPVGRVFAANADSGFALAPHLFDEVMDTTGHSLILTPVGYGFDAAGWGISDNNGPKERYFGSWPKLRFVAKDSYKKYEPITGLLDLFNSAIVGECSPLIDLDSLYWEMPELTFDEPQPAVQAPFNPGHVSDLLLKNEAPAPDSSQANRWALLLPHSEPEWPSWSNLQHEYMSVFCSTGNDDVVFRVSHLDEPSGAASNSQYILRGWDSPPVYTVEGGVDGQTVDESTDSLRYFHRGFQIGQRVKITHVDGSDGEGVVYNPGDIRLGNAVPVITPPIIYLGGEWFVMVYEPSIKVAQYLPCANVKPVDEP